MLKIINHNKKIRPYLDKCGFILLAAMVVDKQLFSIVWNCNYGFDNVLFEITISNQK